MDVERGDSVPKTVRSLLDFVGEKQIDTKFLPYIHKAPPAFRNLNPSSFTPRVVSIGPLHRADKNLQRFEVRKAAFVHDLLCRRLDYSPTQTLTECVQKVDSMIKDIRGSYNIDDIKSYDDNELTKMMVSDACFILEFIHVMKEDSNLRLQDQHIPYDLVLLENQIPFFVLQGIYECNNNHYKEQPSFTAFIHPLMEYTNIFQGTINVGSLSTDYDHILGYFHHCYQFPQNDTSSDFPRSTIHSADELDQAGIKFEPNLDAGCPMAMEVKNSKYYSSRFSFLFKPILTMPILRIDDFTELVLRNLIAYEQSYTVNPCVTSYARAIDMLIDTRDDIAKLVTSKVMVNYIGSNEEAANMINRICKEVAPQRFCYTEQWKQLDDHFNGYWPRKFVNLKRTYFSSPWSIIGLFGGIAIFVLTLLQTIYTMKS